LCNFFRHYKSPSFHSVIRIHLISLSYHILVILPSHFSYMEQMLMLKSEIWDGVIQDGNTYISAHSQDKIEMSTVIDILLVYGYPIIKNAVLLKRKWEIENDVLQSERISLWTWLEWHVRGLCVYTVGCHSPKRLWFYVQCDNHAPITYYHRWDFDLILFINLDVRISVLLDAILNLWRSFRLENNFIISIE